MRIEVADDGPGLPPGTVDLLRRGVRGPCSSGSGLGLEIAADLVRARGGSLSLRSTVHGATAVVELPVAVGLRQRIAG